MFLVTERGDLIAATCIVRIGPLNTRPHVNRRWHDIDYTHGQEARSTTATEAAVDAFLDGAFMKPKDLKKAEDAAHARLQGNLKRRQEKAVTARAERQELSRVHSFYKTTKDSNG